MTQEERITEGMFSAYDSNNDGALSWEEWKVYVETENIMNQNRGDDFWMEQHMNYNYIDSSRNNLIEKEEYEFYLEEIGISSSDESAAEVMASLVQSESPVDLSQKIDSQQGLGKTFALVTGGLVLLLAGAKIYRKLN